MALRLYFVFCICSKVNILERIDIDQKLPPVRLLSATLNQASFRVKVPVCLPVGLSGPGDQ